VLFKEALISAYLRRSKLGKKEPEWAYFREENEDQASSAY